MTAPTPDPADAPESGGADVSPAAVQETMLLLRMATMLPMDPRHRRLLGTARAQLAALADLARPAPPAEPGGGATVKALMWFPKPKGTRAGWWAESPIGRYDVYPTQGAWAWRFGDCHEGLFDTPEDAQEDAGANLGARVLACLDPAPASPDAAARVILAMLEEKSGPVQAIDMINAPMETLAALARGDAP